MDRSNEQVIYEKDVDDRCRRADDLRGERERRVGRSCFRRVVPIL
jgi:hypothetical protein